MLKKLILTLAAASFGAAAAPAADEIINPVMRLNDKARIDVYNRETGIAGQFDSRRFVGTDDWVKIDFRTFPTSTPMSSTAPRRPRCFAPDASGSRKPAYSATTRLP